MSNMTCAYGKWANWHTNMHMFRRAAFVWEMCQKRRIHVKRDRLETPKQICENELIDIPTCTCSEERLLCGECVKRDLYMWKEADLRDQNRCVKKCYFCVEISRKKGMRTKSDLSNTPTDTLKKSVQKWQKRPICIQTSSRYQTRWVQKMYLCSSFGMFKKKKN